MIVLDTHAWIWWVGQSPELPTKVRRLLDRSKKRDRIHVSSISTWEVAMLVARERLVLRTPVEDWLAQSEALPFLHFVPVDNRIALRSVRLPEPFHKDPADRIIVATALQLGARLVTRDEKLRRYAPVETVW